MGISFDLLQLERRPDWYANLHAVEAAMAEQDRIYRARIAAGWIPDEDGWCSPDGIPESDWEHELGLPFPEEPAYAAWLRVQQEAS